MIDVLLAAGLLNAALATVMAIAAIIIGKFWYRPAVIHSLWLLVLVKLITPPLLPLPMGSVLSVGTTDELTALADPAIQTKVGGSLPEWTKVGAKDIDAGHSIQPVAETPASDQEHNAIQSWPTLAVAAVWLCGSAIWWTIALLRLRRLRCVLQHAQPADQSLQQETAELAGQMGLKKIPTVLFVSAPITPMLLALGRKAELVLPMQLWKRLSPPQRRTLLVHELAHLRRRDHWVRRLELVVLGLYWWHPVAWVARRALHDAEEHCCDAWVVWMLPDSVHDYTKTIVDTLAFIAHRKSAVPAGASGMAATQQIKRRLKMIVRQTNPRRQSMVGAVAVILLGCVLLPAWPTWAATDPIPQDPIKQPAPRQFENEVTIPRNPDDATKQPRNRRTGGTTNKNVTSPQEKVSKEAVRQAENEVALLAIQVRLHRAQLEEVKVGLELAEATYQRVRQLHKNNAVAENEVLQAHYAVKTHQARVLIKETELQAAQLRLENGKRFLDTLIRRNRAGPKDSTKGATVPRRPDKTAAARVDGARTVFTALMKSMRAGQTADVESVYRWSRRWLEAEHSLNAAKSARLAALTAHVTRMTQLQDVVMKLVRQGQASAAEGAAARYFVAEAEQMRSQAAQK